MRPSILVDDSAGGSRLGLAPSIHMREVSGQKLVYGRAESFVCSIGSGPGSIKSIINLWVQQGTETQCQVVHFGSRFPTSTLQEKLQHQARPPLPTPSP
ncbi:hypothetical protein J6590_007735 [Homalodisca vitripennis]|nr:hypothetical protein J6590_007735 [Homalodisca vitripennis]